MEKKTWSEHSDMEVNKKSVQNTKKKRTQSDKIGRLKYNQQLLKQTLAEVEEVKLMLRTIFAGLKDSFNFEQTLIERFACEVGKMIKLIGMLSQTKVYLFWKRGSS